MEITVPELGESIVEATVARWLKGKGDHVSVGEPIVELETDKVDLEVGAKSDGILTDIKHQEGEDVKVGDILGIIEEATEREKTTQPPDEGKENNKIPEESKTGTHQPTEGTQLVSEKESTEKATPVARRLAQDLGIDLTKVSPSGIGERITREDVERFAESEKDTTIQTPHPSQPDKGIKQAPAPGSTSIPTVTKPSNHEAPTPKPSFDGRGEIRQKMSRRRRTIANRLVEAQRTTAMLTTFNDVDMSMVMDIRSRRKESFQSRYGVKLGFMSFFVKASIGALKEFPRLNAELQEDMLILKQYYDIGIAIGAEEGLVVPILRDADRMTFAAIEKGIQDFVEKSKSGTLTLQDLSGGTFTITNGGVFGSLLSTPILNPPQVAILGLHRIEDRPIAMNGRVAIRPMMYMALSYDHRIVDGREAVQFLARVKELIEDPENLLLQG